jgi:hypothetical protein
MDLQLDMWTNTDSVQRDQYVCVIMTTVTETEDVTTLDAQLRLRSDILDSNVFPNSEKTGDNIKSWLLFRGKNSANKKDFFNSNDRPEHSDQDSDAGG